MAESTLSVPYQNEASLNATLLLQKQIFQAQASSVSKLVNNLESSNSMVVTDVKVPQILTSRTLSDDYFSSNRLLENEEITLLGFLDVNGKLSVSSRLNEFMLFMTRITKAEHRALCIYTITSKTSEQCRKDFTKFGGLRIVKRWLKIAEEGDFVTEMTALVKLCNKLPFDEGAIREIGIGKVIRKLLKFQSPSGGDVTGLRAQVEALMANWRAKQQEFANASKSRSSAEVQSDKPPSGLALVISDRLVKQRGLPSQLQSDIKNDPDPLDKNESKEDDAVTNPPPLENINSAMEVDNSHFNSQISLSTPSVVKNEPPFAPSALNTSISGNAPKPVSILSSLRAAQSAAQQEGEGAGATGDAPPVLVIRPPVARERKPLDMAEKARSMLAMRAQHALTGAASSASLLSGDQPGSPTSPYSDTGAPLSPSTSNVLSILSAVGKARIASGIQSVDQAPVLKGALKKPSEDGVKKEKKAIHWADENGGLLREVRTIEVAKIKRSTAHYSSTRELSKRERLAEKETHLSKAEDAMQKNTEWRTPTPLSLSIVVLDNISIVADSAEKIAQEKRLAHVLEVRYALDTQIPTDPDEGPSVHEPSSSSARGGASDGTAVGDDGVANIPWYTPGTEPPPEEIHTPTLSAMDILRNRGSYLNDDAIVEVMGKLPYGLQTLEMSTLRSLLQNGEALQTILRHDNTVDEVALALFKRSLQADHVSRNERASRFEQYNAGVESVLESVSRNSRWGGEGGPPGGYPPNPSYDFDYDYDSYGPSRSNGYSDYDRPSMGWSSGYDAPPAPRGGLSVVDLRDRRHVTPHGRFPTTKAATACRFFNTAKGCQFGDKCSFGHFLPNDAPPRAPLNDVYDNESDRARWGGPGHGGPGARRFGEQPRQMSGPGSRLHSQTVDLTKPAAAGGTEVVDLTNGHGQPAKRAKTRFN